MSFLHSILDRCESTNRIMIQEIRGGQFAPCTGPELLAQVNTARALARQSGLRRGDRCVILAPNSIRWAALDLALIAEGCIAVPLYARQSPAELVAMIRDCSPSLICYGDEALRASILERLPDAPRGVLFDEIFSRPATGELPRPVPLADDQPITIIYTSGTSGEAKGVILSAGNVNFMLPRTIGRLDILSPPSDRPDDVFHYTPFCFCASWIALLTFLSRNTRITLSTNLTKLADEMNAAVPEYFLNVPALLERMRGAVEAQFAQWGGIRQKLFENGRQAWLRRRNRESLPFDFFWRAMSDKFIFPAVKKKIGANLKALISGSAPLNGETQLFFEMIGVSVLQVYGLTETTAICTMDDPLNVTPGRVGPAIEGIEMKLGPADEILVRGPNVFQGYWNRPEATSAVFSDGWFRTGDQGEVNAAGNWRITGRIKNLIVLSSGHNVAPEPIEESLLKEIPGAKQVMLVGNGRGFLSAVVTGDVTREQVERALEAVNPQLPHYRRVRGFHILKEPFTPDSGLVTAMGKLKRDAVVERLQAEIEELYCESKV